jgi:hypothetical protein
VLLVLLAAMYVMCLMFSLCFVCHPQLTKASALCDIFTPADLVLAGPVTVVSSVLNISAGTTYITGNLQISSSGSLQIQSGGSIVVSGQVRKKERTHFLAGVFIVIVQGDYFSQCLSCVAKSKRVRYFYCGCRPGGCGAVWSGVGHHNGPVSTSLCFSTVKTIRTIFFFFFLICLGKQRYSSSTISTVVSVSQVASCASSGLSAGAIAGIAVGAVVGGILLAVVVYLLTRHLLRARQKRLVARLRNSEIQSVQNDLDKVDRETKERDESLGALEGNVATLSTNHMHQMIHEKQLAQSLKNM